MKIKNMMITDAVQLEVKAGYEYYPNTKWPVGNNVYLHCSCSFLIHGHVG